MLRTKATTAQVAELGRENQRDRVRERSGGEDRHPQAIQMNRFVGPGRKPTGLPGVTGPLGKNRRPSRRLFVLRSGLRPTIVNSLVDGSVSEGQCRQKRDRFALCSSPPEWWLAAKAIGGMGAPSGGQGMSSHRLERHELAFMPSVVPARCHSLAGRQFRD
jgi:hypothetical protein